MTYSTRNWYALLARRATGRWRERYTILADDATFGPSDTVELPETTNLATRSKVIGEFHVNQPLHLTGAYIDSDEMPHPVLVLIFAANPDEKVTP